MFPKHAHAVALAMALLSSLPAKAAESTIPDVEHVALQAHVEPDKDGQAVLVFDAEVAPGWILYASDFTPAEFGPRAARVEIEGHNGAAPPLQSVAASHGEQKSWAGTYAYTYFSKRGQLRQPLAAKLGGQ